MFLIYKVQVHYQNDFFFGGGGGGGEEAFPFYPLPHIAVSHGHIGEFSALWVFLGERELLLTLSPPPPPIAVIQGHIREFSGVGKMYSMTAVTPKKLALLFWQ